MSSGLLQLRVEEVIERRTGKWSSCAVRELLSSPVLQSRLFVVQEDAAIFDCRGTMRTSTRRDEQFGVLCDWNIGPPKQIS